MPTFNDPLTDATEASQALRGLAHATSSFETPADTYPVMGELLATTRRLSQVLNQVAAAHTSNLGRARDDEGNTLLGAHAAQAAAAELHKASGLLDEAETHLDAATGHSGRIAWAPPPVTVEAEPAQRWISVVFLQGSEADDVLDVIDTDGPNAAIEHLSGFDYGTETTDVAMEDGHVYDHLPAGALDQETDLGDYRMVHNHALGHVGLYRQHTIHPADQLPDPPSNGLVPTHRATGNRGHAPDPTLLNKSTAPAPSPGAAVGPATGVGDRAGREPQENTWFTHRGSTGTQQRGVGL